MKRQTNERKHTRSPIAILKTSNPRSAVEKLKLRSAFVVYLGEKQIFGAVSSSFKAAGQSFVIFGWQI